MHINVNNLYTANEREDPECVQRMMGTMCYTAALSQVKIWCEARELFFVMVGNLFGNHSAMGPFTKFVLLIIQV